MATRWQGKFPRQLQARWAVKDSNLRRLLPTDLQSVPVGHLGNRPNDAPDETVASSRPRLIEISHDRQPSTEADDGNRTRNLPLTRRLLFRLSYVGETLSKGNIKVRPFLRRKALYQRPIHATRLFEARGGSLSGIRFDVNRFAHPHLRGIHLIREVGRLHVTQL